MTRINDRATAKGITKRAAERRATKKSKKPAGARIKVRVKEHEIGLRLWRLYFVVFAFVAVVVALLWNLISLQILPGEDRGFEFLQSQGQARTLRAEKMPAYRGVISDRYGEPLAVSTPVVSIWANPKELLAAKDRWGPLLKAVGLNSRELEKRIARFQAKEFMYLRRQLTPEQADIITGLAIPGVYHELEYKRFYPAGEVAAHIVGFTDIDDEGQEGMELAYNDWLAGTEGAKQVLKDLKGRRVKDVGLIAEPQPGENVQLSIDLRLQYLAYRELKAAVKNHGAKSGSMVILDVNTGEILAMANQPSYNPNDRRRLAKGATRNRAITDQFEPGSTMKPLTIMAALENGIVTPNTLIDTAPGYLRVGRKTLLDPKNYGVIDVTKIITKSSQVGLTKVSLKMQGEQIRDVFFRMGLGQSTGIGFPGENVGVLPTYSRWSPIVQANFSFGYGMTTTTLQLAQAYGVIASGGVKNNLSMIKRTGAVQASAPIFNQQVVGDITKMLKTVVKKGGTAIRADLPSYEVAGKTGTIHKATAGGYADDRYVSLFAGFAPAHNPRIVAVVMIDEPSRGQYFGGQVAAPVFAKVVNDSLRLMQVPPRDTVSNITQLAKREAAE